MFSDQGIVIEFLEDSGLIKCSQNPQLYFHMSEVIEKKKLELNEKVEFSVVPVSPPRPPFSVWALKTEAFSYRGYSRTRSWPLQLSLTHCQFHSRSIFLVQKHGRM